MEMLVVISVLSVVSVMILTIFTRSLRGGNKAQIIATIKQNGQSVLENMDKTIRNSDNVVCPVVTPPATTADSNNLVVKSGGIYTRYRFISPSPSPTPTVNGLIKQDNPTKQSVAGVTPAREETDAELRNRICQFTDPLLTSALTLTDTNTQTGISVTCAASDGVPDCTENPIFSRDRSAGFKDQVKIHFDLKPGVSASQAIAGQIDPVIFQTTIQLR